MVNIPIKTVSYTVVPVRYHEAISESRGCSQEEKGANGEFKAKIES